MILTCWGPRTLSWESEDDVEWEGEGGQTKGTGSSMGSSSVSVEGILLRGRFVGMVRPMCLSGALFRKSYSLSAEGGNLTLSLVRESTKSRSSGLAPRDARDVGVSGISTADLGGAAEKGLSASAVRSVHWMGMENR